MKRRSKKHPMPSGRYEEVLERDRWSCQGPKHNLDPHTCSGRLEVHHKLPRGMGGSSDPTINDADNLITLCSGHHAWVESHRADAYELGLLTRRT